MLDLKLLLTSILRVGWAYPRDTRGSSRGSFSSKKGPILQQTEKWKNGRNSDYLDIMLSGQKTVSQGRKKNST